jgi:PAS domain S-box-containing protein
VNLPGGEEVYYRRLCEHLGVAVISTDLELNICTWNAAAARTFGAAAERMIGTPVIRILPAERRDWPCIPDKPYNESSFQDDHRR